ncbi:signal peptidase I, partial [Microbacterium sp.]|uniref:signal peptidase I n=1 Tax=Microbacterium sp. TaxID=51671 RepID=UPI003A953EDD
MREVLLTLAAIGGVICIVLVIMAFTGGYSLIMFKTGSMAPTIPAGSVALVQKIPASDIAVGDVVTVDRDAALPITHRVTGVEPADAGDMRTLTMKGDANDVEDPAPYIVSDVRIVRGSVPALANVIVWFGSPWVLGGVTLGASLLVVWAFWPRRERMAPEESSGDGEEPAAPGALGAGGAGGGGGGPGGGWGGGGAG